MKTSHDSAVVSDKGLSGPKLAAVALAFALLATLSGCGKASSATKASPQDNAGTSTTTTAAIIAEDAGGGEIQSVDNYDYYGQPEGAYGSRSNRIPHDKVSAFDAISLSIKGENLCVHPDIVKYRRAFSRFGINAWYNKVYIGPGIGGEDSVLWTLVCSNPTGTIWPNTAGPGGDGVSLPCPEFAPIVNIFEGAVYFTYTGTTTRADNMSQTAGGHGKNSDGLWNFKFHNWNSRGDVTPTLWAICYSDYD